MVGVSTLQMMAQQAHEQDQASDVFSAIDARMGEIYYAQYKADDNGLMHLLMKSKLLNLNC